ncbi:AI-2E family transporter [Paracoccus sp. 1_MG-2023]|uniref:AI-2E family transporter n=1 Tax=unclassified Paracoccus (in: a-proteobacteria) TaxID=2688777 RepID=UPI001C089EC2|nr:MULTISPECIES: AI-2E family transporter [unclassified Paracoccus (in: a-proteobacteria)]MBU2956418.1 AI-2E family transporter [Paracoccus sp. C2R09]MDO6669848.1 AI-2E family transporter [Paracoccus sp. 1_MG-2023]
MPHDPSNPSRDPVPAALRVVVATIAIVILLAATWFWANLLLQIFAAILLAIALQSGARGLHRLTGLGMKPGVLVVLLAFLVVTVTALRMAGPAIMNQFEQLVQGLPDSWQALSDWISAHPIGQAVIDRLPTSEGSGGMSQMAGSLPNLLGLVTGTLNTMMGSMTAIFLLIVLSIYFAMESDTYREGALRLVAPDSRDRARDILDDLGHKLAHWMGGQALDMLFVAMLAGLGLWALDVPLALILAVIAGITNVVPIIGPFVSGAIAAVAAAPEGLDTALYVVLLFTAIQMFEGNILMPMIQRYAVELPPALTIIAIVAVGSLFNPAAVILATPLLIVAITLIRRIYVEGVLGDTGSDD